MTTEEAWLAGIIEGESCIDLKQRKGRSPRLRVRIKMNDEDIVARVAAIWGSSYHPVHPYRGRPAHHQQQYSAEITGQRAEKIIESVHSLLGGRRRDQVHDALSQTEMKKTHSLHH